MVSKVKRRKLSQELIVVPISTGDGIMKQKAPLGDKRQA